MHKHEVKEEDEHWVVLTPIHVIILLIFDLIMIIVKFWLDLMITILMALKKLVSKV